MCSCIELFGSLAGVPGLEFKVARLRVKRVCFLRTKLWIPCSGMTSMHPGFGGGEHMQDLQQQRQLMIRRIEEILHRPIPTLGIPVF